jgi:hypothetical protein
VRRWRDPLFAAVAPLTMHVPAARAALTEALAADEFGAVGLEDEAMVLLSEGFARFTAAEVAPHVQAWHKENALIPLPLIANSANSAPSESRSRRSTAA